MFYLIIETNIPNDLVVKLQQHAAIQQHIFKSQGGWALLKW